MGAEAGHPHPRGVPRRRRAGQPRASPARADEAKQFLGPLADQFLVFCDPDRTFVRGLGVATLPAFVFVRGDGSVQAAAEGWNPAEWRHVAKTIADNTSWMPPTIPGAGDPSPFHGTPALG